MRIKFWQSLSAALAIAVIATPAFGQSVVIVNDSFTDGDRTVTGASGSDIEAAFYGSSTSGAVEDNVNDGVGTGIIGLVSGTSGRQIHSVFPTQTLATAGDMITSSVTFTTPGFIASNATAADFAAADAAQGGGASVNVPASSDDFKFGLFQSVPGLNADTSYGSNSPNPLYNGLSGYNVELDVDPASVTNQDIDIRRSDITQSTGRLLSTNTGIPSIGSGPDLGYVFQPNNQYTVTQKLTLDAAGGIVIDVTFEDVTGGSIIGTHQETDAAPTALDFGLLALGSSSEAFGLSNDGGVADNGIDINNFTLTADIAPAVVPEPSSLALLGLMGCAGFIRRRR